MKKNIYILIGIGLVIFVGAWLMFSGGLWRATAVNISENVKENTAVIELAKKEVILIINNGGGNINTIAVEFKEGMAAFDLLKDGAEKLTLPLKTKNYDAGIFIEAIGDKKNGQDGKYWLYYVNGQLPVVAADKKEIKLGDKVEFKFEKSPF
ncbi:MAG: DUF4430 domain-containing protein [Patescibacteria group bacterium]